ncbi:MAG: MBL fold metallo-hydrolase [Methanocorpusculum sp.]|nr:MBL fold metallo-hydrolase [Methanocorpusculum sp.]
MNKLSGKRKYITPSYIKRILPYLSLIKEEDRDKYFDDTEKAVVELVTKLDKKPKDVLWIIQSIGLYLYGNSGKNFYCDWQKIKLNNDITFWTLQPPGGGCLHIFQTPKGKLMIDAGYGVNYSDWLITLKDLGLGDFSDVKRVLCTHGDADHVGMTGFLPAPAYMHPTTKKLLDDGSRGFAAVNNYKDLVRIYTLNINTISKLNMPKEVILSKTEPIGKRGVFSVIDTIDFEGIHLEVWESFGGHLAGQIFFYEPEFGLLFTSDCILNPKSLSRWRLIYGAIPDYLITSVNINSKLATEERNNLMKLAHELDSELRKDGKRLRLCCGHGAVSAYDDSGNMIVADKITHYARRGHLSENIHDKLTKLAWVVKRKTL